MRPQPMLRLVGSGSSSTNSQVRSFFPLLHRSKSKEVKNGTGFENVSLCSPYRKLESPDEIRVLVLHTGIGAEVVRETLMHTRLFPVELTRKDMKAHLLETWSDRGEGRQVTKAMIRDCIVAGGSFR